MKLLAASVAAMVGCGSTSPRTLPSSGAARAATVSTGALLWIKPAAEPDGPLIAPPSRDPMQRDRLMVFDLTTRTSIDIGESDHFRLGALAPSLDAAYLTSYNAVSRVARSGERWHLADLGRMGPTGEALQAVAPDGSAAVILEADTLCVVRTGTRACAITTPLPFEWDVNARVSYTRGGRLVVSVPTGRQEDNAVGMGQTLQIAVVDLEARSAARLGMDAIGYFATVSLDGRLLWTEHATEHAADKLLVAIAPLDQLAAKRTIELGPAVAQSDADCSFAGTERIVCLVLPDHALISASTRDGSHVTLEPMAVMPSFFVSPDARWGRLCPHRAG